MIYRKLKLERKIGKVASHGFKYVDFWSWRGRDFTDFKKELVKYRLGVSSIVSNMENSPTISSEYDDYIEEVKDSIEVAHDLECERMILLTDAMTSVIPGTDPPITPAKRNSLPFEKKMGNLQKALNKVVDLAEKEGIIFCLEALSPIDHPGYFLDRSKPAIDIVNKTRCKNLRMLFDIYHMQVAEGNVTSTVVKNIKSIGFIHFADVPGRHEPGTGELNLTFILSQLRKINYEGNVEFEYSPLNGDDRSLSLIKELTAGY